MMPSGSVYSPIEMAANRENVITPRISDRQDGVKERPRAGVAPGQFRQDGPGGAIERVKPVWGGVSGARLRGLKVVAHRQRRCTSPIARTRMLDSAFTIGHN